MTHLARLRADEEMLFHVVLGPLHVDPLPGRKFRADPIEGCGTGLKVQHQLFSENMVETPAFQAVHHDLPRTDPRNLVEVLLLLTPRVQRLLFGLEPVLPLVAGSAAAAYVQFVGAAANPVL
jgi:hypothetical protein